MIRHSFLLLAALAVACSTAGPAAEDAKQLLDVEVRSAGISGSSANFEVSIANVSSETVIIRGVAVNPGVPREMYGVPVTSTFTLEPGESHTVLAEMRPYHDREPRTDWPDILAVDISCELNGKSAGKTYRVNVQPHR